MAELVPAIHVLVRGKDVDARDKRGHDGTYFAASAFSICGMNTLARLSGEIGPTSL